MIDFGLSKNTNTFEMSTKCGTEYYAAPEIYEDPIYTSKVDIYAIGQMMKSFCFNFNSWELMDLILKMTQKDPGKRLNA